MCGIAGVFDPRSRPADSLAEVAGRMTNSLVHRGPDDVGLWVDGAAGVALGHRRLSILDLSPAGHQPMVSSSGRYTIVFNGEIYNHNDVRRDLDAQGHRLAWRGRSDTETLLEGISVWGIDETLKRCAGMFAFALWDRRDGILSLARDRLGEKPLYYGWAGRALLFGSELKALRAHPEFCPDVNRDALALYVRYNYVPAPWSIYKNAAKLLPGQILRTDAHTTTTPVPRQYWSARDVAARGLSDPIRGDEHEVVDELERLIKQSIAGQMIADVPVGAFLSGGIDSSTVAALMQAQSARPVKTFSIGFEEKAYNEAQHARRVAEHLGTDHTELYVTPTDALNVVPKLPALYDEPFGDSSQIPTFLMMALARRHVTVALSGDAGDELFGGYNRYFWGHRIWKRISSVPSGLRRAASGTVRSVSPRTWDKLFSVVSSMLPRSKQYRNVGDKLYKLASILNSPNPHQIYVHLVSQWTQPEAVLREGVEPPTPVTDHQQWLGQASFPDQMMFLDLVTYLPDDILVKVDRAAMGVSLETRVPLLDHRVVEFAWKIPWTMKIVGFEGKQILKQLLFRHVPRELVERPKMGFGVPIDSWLRGPLRDWAESLLAEDRLRDEGFFDPAPIRKRWAEHVSNVSAWHYPLWEILMFQAWQEDNARSVTRGVDGATARDSRLDRVFAAPIASAQLG
jgi:asparagine synthase (glutamine-hydrolysing)